MRQNIIITLCTAALFSAVGCSKVVDPATGCVTFKLMNETEVIDITKSSVADFTSLPASLSSQAITGPEQASVPYQKRALTSLVSADTAILRLTEERQFP